MALEGPPSLGNNNENEEEKKEEAESFDNSVLESGESGKEKADKKKNYVDGSDSISHQLSGTVREHLDDKTIEKIEAMKKKQEEDQDDDRSDSSPKAA